MNSREIQNTCTLLNLEYKSNADYDSHEIIITEIIIVVHFIKTIFHEATTNVRSGSRLGLFLTSTTSSSTTTLLQSCQSLSLFLVLNGNIQRRNDLSEVFHRQRPVSYTHLDVYKRQVQDFSNSEVGLSIYLLTHCINEDQLNCLNLVH